MRHRDAEPDEVLGKRRGRQDRAREHRQLRRRRQGDGAVPHVHRRRSRSDLHRRRGRPEAHLRPNQRRVREVLGKQPPTRVLLRGGWLRRARRWLHGDGFGNPVYRPFRARQLGEPRAPCHLDLGGRLPRVRHNQQHHGGHALLLGRERFWPTG